LGRVTSVTHPDLNVIQTTYADPGVATLTDETGRQRREINDSLGRLIQVDEPGTGYAGTAASGGLTIGGTIQTKPATNPTPGTGSVTFSGSEQAQGGTN